MRQIAGTPSKSAGDIASSGSFGPAPWHRRDIAAVLDTLCYFDVFEWPLSVDEIVKCASTQLTTAQVEAALFELTASGSVVSSGRWFALRDGEARANRRTECERASVALWVDAHRFGRWAGRVPFVRLVAVSGALSYNAAFEGDDIDLFVVTESGRVWLARGGLGFVVRVVKVITRGRVILCPNFVVGVRSMTLPERDRCTAHDIAQLVAITGPDTLTGFREANSWTDELLPNVPRSVPAKEESRVGFSRRMIEGVLRGGLFDRVERAERQRRCRRFGQMSGLETRMNDDCCKGHIDGHRTRILHAYAERLASFGLANGGSTSQADGSPSHPAAARPGAAQ